MYMTSKGFPETCHLPQSVLLTKDVLRYRRTVKRLLTFGSTNQTIASFCSDFNARDILNSVLAREQNRN